MSRTEPFIISCQQEQQKNLYIHNIVPVPTPTRCSPAMEGYTAHGLKLVHFHALFEVVPTADSAEICGAKVFRVMLYVTPHDIGCSFYPGMLWLIKPLHRTRQ